MSQVEDGHLEPGPHPPRLPRLLAGVSLKALFVLTAKTTRRICSCQVPRPSLGSPTPPWGPPPLPGVPRSSLKSLAPLDVLLVRRKGCWGVASELCFVCEVK